MNEEQKNEEVEPTELEKVQRQAEEYLNGWKRAQADFANYKRDEAKRVEEFARYANEDLIEEIMGVLDDLHVALKHVNDAGIKHVSKKFDEVLKKYGVERIPTEGQKFDPSVHEVVQTDLPAGSQEATEEKLEEVRAGYRLHDKVIRPARVRILKK
jgi:molecular chaperone GrpE